MKIIWVKKLEKRIFFFKKVTTESVCKGRNKCIFWGVHFWNKNWPTNWEREKANIELFKGKVWIFFFFFKSFFKSPCVSFAFPTAGGRQSHTFCTRIPINGRWTNLAWSTAWEHLDRQKRLGEAAEVDTHRGMRVRAKGQSQEQRITTSEISPLSTWCAMWCAQIEGISEWG